MCSQISVLVCYTLQQCSYMSLVFKALTRKKNKKKKVTYGVSQPINSLINCSTYTLSYICSRKAAFPACIIHYVDSNPCLNRLEAE